MAGVNEPVVPRPPIDCPFSQASPPDTCVSEARLVRGLYGPQQGAVWQFRVHALR